MSNSILDWTKENADDLSGDIYHTLKSHGCDSSLFALREILCHVRRWVEQRESTNASVEKESE